MDTTTTRPWLLTLTCFAIMGLSTGCEGAKDKCLKKMDLPSCRALCETERDMEGCNQLARGLGRGVQSAHHTEEIRLLFERACHGGLAVGCVNRASQCNVNGLHFPDKPAKPGIVCARRWYGLACERGSKNGCQLADKYNDPAMGR